MFPATASLLDAAMAFSTSDSSMANAGVQSTRDRAMTAPLTLRMFLFIQASNLIWPA